MSICGLLAGPGPAGVVQPARKGGGVLERGLPRFDHHHSKASNECRKLTRHWITSFALVEHDGKMGRFAGKCKGRRKSAAFRPHARVPGATELDCNVISNVTSLSLRLPVLAGFLLFTAAGLAGCATTGSGSGAAICHAADGTLVPLSDQRCPQAVRDALNPAEPPPMSIPQSMANQQYDAEHGLLPGDWGYRPYE